MFFLVNSKHQKDSWWDPRREGLNFEPKKRPISSPLGKEVEKTSGFDVL